LYVALVVVIALLFVHATLMAMCMASEWLAALVTMWMVLFWAVALLVIAEDGVVVAASIVATGSNDGIYCRVDALAASAYPLATRKTCKLRAGRRVWT